MPWLYIVMTSLALASTDAIPGGPECIQHSYDVPRGKTMATLGDECKCKTANNDPPWSSLCEAGTYCAIWTGLRDGDCRVVRPDPPPPNPCNSAECPADWYCAEDWDTPVAIPVTIDRTGICRHNSELADYLRGKEDNNGECMDTTTDTQCNRMFLGDDAHGECGEAAAQFRLALMECLASCDRCGQFQGVITYSTTTTTTTTTAPVDENTEAVTTKTITENPGAENPANTAEVRTTERQVTRRTMRTFQTIKFTIPTTKPVLTAAHTKPRESSADTTKQDVWRVIYIACVAIGLVTM